MCDIKYLVETLDLHIKALKTKKEEKKRRAHEDILYVLTIALSRLQLLLLDSEQSVCAAAHQCIPQDSFQIYLFKVGKNIT